VRRERSARALRSVGIEDWPARPITTAYRASEVTGAVPENRQWLAVLNGGGDEPPSARETEPPLPVQTSHPSGSEILELSAPHPSRPNA